MIWAYSPEGERVASLPQRAERPDLRGGSLVIGLFSNRKANAGLLLDGIGKHLEERLGASIRRYDKPNASHAASKELVDRMAKEVGLVVAASSD
ncbi:MAG: hypothetical protein JRH16_02625 [Deltaproteobacteria bacterium]|nr:hypothetical protein [Deltaproteobacteria bacterium]